MSDCSYLKSAETKIQLLEDRISILEQAVANLSKRLRQNGIFDFEDDYQLISRKQNPDDWDKGNHQPNEDVDRNDPPRNKNIHETEAAWADRIFERAADIRNEVCPYCSPWFHGWGELKHCDCGKTAGYVDDTLRFQQGHLSDEQKEEIVNRINSVLRDSVVEEAKSQYKESIDRPSLADLVDWSKAPDWAEWAAQDPNGGVFFFECKPVWDTGEWIESQHDSFSVGFKPLAHDWQTPLKRPIDIDTWNDPTPSDSPIK